MKKFTPREIIYRIRSTYKEHKGNSVLFNGHIWNVFLTSLREVIQTNLEVKRLLRQNEYGSVKEITMHSVSGNTLGLDDCEFLCKSSLEFKYDSIDSIFTSDLINPTSIELVSFKDYVNKTKIKMPMKPKLAFILNGYLYSTVCYPTLNIKGVFVSDTFNSIGSCGFLDTELDAPDYLIQTSISNALREFNIFKQTIYNRPEEKVTTTEQ